MKDKKITLNEELNRMRFLFKAQSGKKMTISEINKTYLIEQDGSSSQTPSSASNSSPSAGSTTTTQQLIRQLDNDPFFIKQANRSTTDLLVQRRGNKSYVFAGTPANIIAPNDQSLNGVVFARIAGAGTGNNQAMNNFLNYLTVLLDTGAFQLSNLSMNNQSVPSDLTTALGILYDNIVRGPIIRVLQTPAFGLPLPIPQNFGQFLSGLTTNNLALDPTNPNFTQNVASLRRAINTSKAGLNQFRLFITRAPNAPTFTSIQPPPQPITGYVAPSAFSGNQSAGILADLANIGVGGTNDTVNITITIRTNGFLSLNSVQSNNIAVAATQELCNAFYRIIENNRQELSGRGNAGNNPINIPTLNDLLADPTVTNITNGWIGFNDWVNGLSIASINISISTLDPSGIQLSRNITVVQQLPEPMNF